jgi:hypothetical protein
MLDSDQAGPEPDERHQSAAPALPSFALFENVARWEAEVQSDYSDFQPDLSPEDSTFSEEKLMKRFEIVHFQAVWEKSWCFVEAETAEEALDRFYEGEAELDSTQITDAAEMRG